MKILSIETSCDETAVSIVEANGGLESPTFSVLGNALFSQIEIHKEYGGVFPMMAKREHAKNLPEILRLALTEASMIKSGQSLEENKWKDAEEILKKEDGLYEGFRKIFENIKKPEVDVIAVTSGPGLEPALWVGISFAKTLGKLWDLPVVPVNHMEGHIASVLLDESEFESEKLKVKSKSNAIQFPALALLISGGHTELVYMENWGKYKVIGETKDDAVGEAFDKTARMLGLPYPGGPEVSRLAEKARTGEVAHNAKFTRPMLHSHDLNFSFSGLKTAVLYYIRDITNNGETVLEEINKMDIAREFEDAVVDILIKKTKDATEENPIKTLIIAGGVIANKKIKEEFSKFEKEFNDLKIKTPTKDLSGDNSLMIAASSYINICLNPKITEEKHNIIAKGNLKLG